MGDSSAFLSYQRRCKLDGTYISSYLATGHVSSTTVVTRVTFNWIISVQFHPLCLLVLPKRYFLYFIKGLKRSDHWRDEDNCLIPRPVPQTIEY